MALIHICNELKNTIYCCYLHKRNTGAVFYVGKGTITRAMNANPKLRSRNKHYASIINQEGIENIQIEIIPTNTEIEALELEKRFISFLRPYFKLCNLTDGGEGVSGLVHSEESKQKMSIKHIGIPCKEHVKQIVSNRHLGKITSIEVKQKISDSEKGKLVSEETKKKIALSKLGKCHTLEHNRKIKEAVSADKGPGAKLNWFIVVSIRNNYDIFNISQRELAKWYNLPQATVHNILTYKSWKV